MVSVPIVQLDFETGEFVAEYPSLKELAEDYNIPTSTLNHALQNYGCCIGRIPRHHLLFVKKVAYKNMIKGLMYEPRNN